MDEMSRSARFVAVFAMVMLVINASAKAQSNSCATSPKLVAQCFIVHGRLTMANGNPSFRIWQIGTKHVLGVYSGQAADINDLEEFPPKIHALIPKDPWQMEIYGDYTVCPFEKARSGWMQDVCIADAAHLVAINQRETPRKP
jgi:hypothetical protein